MLDSIYTNIEILSSQPVQDLEARSIISTFLMEHEHMKDLKSYQGHTSNHYSSSSKKNGIINEEKFLSLTSKYDDSFSSTTNANNALCDVDLNHRNIELDGEISAKLEYLCHNISHEKEVRNAKV